MRVRVKGVNRIRKRIDGQTVELHYARGVKGQGAFWRSDSGVALGSAEYLAAYAATAQRAEKAEPADTFGEIVTAYLSSREFNQLGDRTRRDYIKMADMIRAKFGTAPRAAFNSPKIRGVALAWRDGIKSDRTAQYAWTVLRLIVGWAYDRGKLDFHHLKGGGTVYASDRSEIIWTEDEIAAVEKAAPAYIHRLARGLAETGMRPGDLIRLTRNRIETTPAGRRIVVRTRKRNKMASIPVSEAMGALIDATPKGRLLIFTNAKGQPWTEEAASKAVLRGRKAAGLPKGPRWYDCRGSAVTRLVRLGVDIPTLALIFGWSPKTAAAMVEKYAYLDPSMTDAVLVKLGKK